MSDRTTRHLPRRAVLAGLGGALLSACTGLPLITPPAKVPMDSVLDLAGPPARAATLLVLLPGAYDGPGDFLREGFVQAVRARGLAVDVQLADAHAGYYTSQQIVQRVHDDIVQPARARGYARIWLCGISLGGYGSLLYAARHGASIDGLFVMAAFLGRRDLPAHIAQAGGLAAWDGQMAGADAHDLALWRWLRLRRPRRGAPAPAVADGLGRGRPFRDEQPAGRRHAAAGPCVHHRRRARLAGLAAPLGGLPGPATVAG